MDSIIEIQDSPRPGPSRPHRHRYTSREREIIAIPSSDPPSEDLPDLHSGVRYERLPTPDNELVPLNSPVNKGTRKRTHDALEPEPQEETQAVQKRTKGKGKAKQIDPLEKQLDKAQKLAEKEYNKRFKEANKLRTSKSDTLKEIKLYLSPSLRSPPSSFSPILPALRGKFESLNSTVLPLESTLPNLSHHQEFKGLICFKRYVKSAWNDGKRAWEPLDPEEEGWVSEGLVGIYLEAEQWIDLIHSDETNTWITSLLSFLKLHYPAEPPLPRSPTYPRKKDGLPQVMLFIHGLKAYYKSTARSRGADKVSKRMVDRELLRVWMEWGWFQVQVETMESLEVWMYNISADLAIRPYRLLQKSHAQSITRESNQKGSSRAHTLELMLQEIPGVTPSGAVGIASKYKSFRGLMREFIRVEEEEGRERGRGLVADCMVKNLKNGVQNERKIGTAVSRHIWNAMREPNPHANV